jgi:hypothetical protein
MNMKYKYIAILAVLAIAFAGFVPSAVAQNPAYQTSFTTSITYQNVDTSATTSLVILFYPSPTSTSPISITRPNLPAGAGTSVFIGTLGEISPNFRGTAIMQSDKRLVATLVQVPQNSTTVKNRPLSNGFSEGSSQILIATVLKNVFNANSVFVVQNTDTAPNNITIMFYNVSAVKVHEITTTVQAGAGYFVDTGQVTQLSTSFNGSAVISATRADNSPGSIVGTAMEMSTNGTSVLAFESVASGAAKVYMASAICDAFGGQNSAYAVQNTSLTTATTVTVRYSNGIVHQQNIGPGSKQSFVACSAPGMTAGFSGSATIESTATNIVAIGKVFGAGLSTGFLGEASGSAKLAMPYVRWSQSQYDTGVRQRTFIAIQNVGAASIPAGSIKISYRDKNGAEVVAHTIDTALAVGAKANSNPYFNASPGAAEFGYYTDGTFGGSAIITCSAANCELVGIARVQSRVPGAALPTVAEDYNGISVP